jgi:ABC-type branched-subunit amino acid transport system substrate-binding protein
MNWVLNCQIKNNRFISVVFFILSIFVSSNIYANLNICNVTNNYRYGLMDKARKNFRINGLNLAYKNYQDKLKQNEKSANFIFVDSNKDLSLIELLEMAKNKNCHIITGLHTSKTALIAGPWLVKNKILGVSSTATANKINEYYPYLISAMVPATDFIKAIDNFINTKGHNKKVFLIKFKDDIYSKLISEQIKKNLKREPSIISTNKGSTLSQTDLNRMINHKNAVIMFTGFHFQSLPILNQLRIASSVLTENKTLIIGSPEWSFSSTLYKRLDILNTLPNLHITTLWNLENQSNKSLSYIQQYNNIYNEFPHQKTAFAYDTLSMILDCAKESDNSVKKTYSCLRSKRVHHGVTGDYHFDGKSTHSHKLVHIVSIHKKNLARLK